MSGSLEAFCLLAQDGVGGVNSIVPILPWVMIGILFYLILLRPEKRKRAELQAMLSNLKKNDRVVTIGGIIGTVVQASQDSDEVTLKVDENNNTRIRVLRSSISRIVTSDQASSEAKGT